MKGKISNACKPDITPILVDGLASTATQGAADDSASRLPQQALLDGLQERPQALKKSNSADWSARTLPQWAPGPGTSSKALLIQSPPHPTSSDEMFGLGELPAPGKARWEYLTKTENWHPERQELHSRLLSQARTASLRLAESIESDGYPPTLFALRGNTATGKTRIATKTIPVLANALKKSSGGGCINPDIFKRSLAESQGEAMKLSSAQVHAESCVLADRLENELRSQRTTSGAMASILVDKRLANTHEVDSYVSLAKETGRKVELCDIDAPLERSLMGVLQRSPGGDDPRPPYVAVANGFSTVRSNRLDVIDRFLSNPTLGSYRLFGTNENGEKVMVASVADGELSIHDPKLYESITAPEDFNSGDKGEQVIDTALIDRLSNSIDDPKRATDARAALEKYKGMTWSNALAAHSSLI
ncbi:XopAJ/AvrRxo1 family type III secretion system effector zeta toxin [Xanthomonas translucens]|uniref:XopAJ/AvrRxo1 family type III secretion system effector zeta toxin n=1 Tax=Xanthomonas translucens pv. translucens TaxID=134875 RepID=A0ABW9KWX5_XANCT|nr:XopAJ/AvrRxo1 family type III secretion system effector zeta toxin [Xanthomonas translucens]QSQ33731.1 zeta toxin family protein [Xanthomonas translucens pv. translucens]